MMAQRIPPNEFPRVLLQFVLALDLHSIAQNERTLRATAVRLTTRKIAC